MNETQQAIPNIRIQKLEATGRVGCIPASELRVGDVRIYNGGTTGEITDIKRIGKRIQITTENGVRVTNAATWMPCTRGGHLFNAQPEEMRRRIANTPLSERPTDAPLPELAAPEVQAEPETETKPEPVPSPLPQIARLTAVKDAAANLLRAEKKVEKFSDTLFSAELGTSRAQTLRRELRIAAEHRDACEHRLHITLVEAGLARYDAQRYGKFLTYYSGSGWAVHREGPTTALAGRM